MSTVWHQVSLDPLHSVTPSSPHLQPLSSSQFPILSLASKLHPRIHSPRNLSLLPTHILSLSTLNAMADGRSDFSNHALQTDTVEDLISVNNIFSAFKPAANESSPGRCKLLGKLLTHVIVQNGTQRPLLWRSRQRWPCPKPDALCQRHSPGRRHERCASSIRCRSSPGCS